jgi:predicted phosphatase
MTGHIKVIAFDRDQTLYDDFSAVGGLSPMDPGHEDLINAMEGHLFNGVEAMLRELKVRGYVVAMATSGHQKGADLFVAKKNLQDIFSTVSGGRDKYAVVDELARQHGVQPYQVMFVDDQHDFGYILGYHIRMRMRGLSAARGPLVVPAWNFLRGNVTRLQRDIDATHALYPGAMFIQAVDSPSGIFTAIDCANAEIEKDLQSGVAYVPPPRLVI